jgi:geranylgeranyl diphosphate synthase type II
MRYSALSPGKRLRPLLALTACEAVGAPWQRALPAAAAVECVHAFSLVHDDLPAMDDDDYRRGRLTTHRKFDEGLAVLAGDALLALAFEALTRMDAPPRRVSIAVAELARATGSEELVGGQALDLAAEGRPAGKKDVHEIHVRKTAALISCSLVLGGLAGGATTRQIGVLRKLGLDLGLAFQIRDDLLNLESSLARLGKRAGTDHARGKATYPRAVGLEAARIEARRRIAKALAAAASLGPRARNLVQLIEATARRDR